jgi:hypothetical protein
MENTGVKICILSPKRNKCNNLNIFGNILMFSIFVFTALKVCKAIQVCPSRLKAAYKVKK